MSSSIIERDFAAMGSVVCRSRYDDHCERFGDLFSKAFRDPFRNAVNSRSFRLVGMRPLSDNPPMQWDIFCRVIDNHGDIGVCWRLAADLAARSERVRLWVDDASALAWMAPNGADGVLVLGWPDEVADTEPGDVVIEAFGCKLPDRYVARMASLQRSPMWINLEYLSAEPYVERAHKLRSPQSNESGKSLNKWFFYPGFSDRTGGLIREPGLLDRQRSFDAVTWLVSRGLAPMDGEQVVGLFCYSQPAISALLDRLSTRPTLLLTTPGFAAEQVGAALGASMRRGLLRAVLLPSLSQVDYDHLLWASDINFVRGEDSFVRAQWAGKPFVWQIYPQDDDAHVVKLDAFLERFLGATPGERQATEIMALFRAWNANTEGLPELPEFADWHRRCQAWRDVLYGVEDLTTQLIGFVSETS